MADQKTTAEILQAFSQRLTEMAMGMREIHDDLADYLVKDAPVADRVDGMIAAINGAAGEITGIMGQLVTEHSATWNSALDAVQDMAKNVSYMSAGDFGPLLDHVRRAPMPGQPAPAAPVEKDATVMAWLKGEDFDVANPNPPVEAEKEAPFTLERHADDLA